MENHMKKILTLAVLSLTLCSGAAFADDSMGTMMPSMSDMTKSATSTATDTGAAMKQGMMDKAAAAKQGAMDKVTGKITSAKNKATDKTNKTIDDAVSPANAMMMGK